MNGIYVFAHKQVENMRYLYWNQLFSEITYKIFKLFDMSL